MPSQNREYIPRSPSVVDQVAALERIYDIASQIIGHSLIPSLNDHTAYDGKVSYLTKEDYNALNDAIATYDEFWYYEGYEAEMRESADESRPQSSPAV